MPRSNEARALALTLKVETTMTVEPPDLDGATASQAADRPEVVDRATDRPEVVDRATFQAELDGLRIREKVHTKEGDAIAAARRRLPMVELDGTLELTGPHGRLSLLDSFQGRRQLVAYYFMWNPGQPAAGQCEGCTWVNSQVAELSYLHSRDITYAVFCQGPYDESTAYRQFMGWEMPWYSAQDSLESLLVGRRVGMFHLVCYLREVTGASRPTGRMAAV
jgi:hypothetical protein